MTLERICNTCHKTHPDGYSFTNPLAVYMDWKDVRNAIMRFPPVISSLWIVPA